MDILCSVLFGHPVYHAEAPSNFHVHTCHIVITWLMCPESNCVSLFVDKWQIHVKILMRDLLIMLTQQKLKKPVYFGKSMLE